MTNGSVCMEGNTELEIRHIDVNDLYPLYLFHALLLRYVMMYDI